MGKSLPELMRAYERQIVVSTLARNNGNYDMTAAALGITRRALDKVLARHSISKRRFTRVLPIPSPPSKETK